MSPLQTLQMHQTYDQLQRDQRAKRCELRGEDPRARDARATGGVTGRLAVTPARRWPAVGWRRLFGRGVALSS